MSGPVADDNIPFPAEEEKRLEARKWILSYARKGAVGAEIGVFRGHFSAVLAEVLRPRKLYLVDPWRKLGKDFGWGKDSPYTGYGKLTTEYAYRDTLHRISQFKTIDITVVEGFADDFFRRLEEKLDWVYLDASHQYGATLNELKLIDAALKQDGVIIGDDWQSARHHKDHGVFRAAHEFVRTHLYEIVAAGPAGQWCLRKGVVAGASVVGTKVRTSWTLHAELDSLQPQGKKEQNFTVGGVVVLSNTAPKGLKLRVSGAREYGVTWDIPSPWIAKKYKNSPNSANSRFRVKGVRSGGEEPVELYLENAAGKKAVLFRIS